MIQLQDFSLRNTEKNLISNLSSRFKKNELWAIIGKNGIGKTTFLHTLAGLHTNYHGTVMINGKDTRTNSRLNNARNTALLPQKTEAHLNCTVQQSLVYARYPWHSKSSEISHDEKIISQALAIMELEALQNKSIHALSGGESQRLEIATLLSQDSEILLLDEPFNHLDLVFRYKLMEHLMQIKSNKCIIISTHDLQYVQTYCTHVMMIINANHIILGTISEVFNHANLRLMLGDELSQTLLNPR